MQQEHETAAQTLRRLQTTKEARSLGFGSDKEAAELIGVSGRTFNDLQDEPWFPDPIILGPRLRRWDLDQLAEAMRQHAPRQRKGQEPAQLARARIERMKADTSFVA